MIRAVLIDDERHALDALQNGLAPFQQVEIVGKFANPYEGLRQMGSLEYNTVFLDVEMPGMNGLEVAEAILDLPSVADIVFVTAYDRFAVDAFEVNALDYLLKPVKHSRLAKTIDKLLNNRRNAQPSVERTGLSIACFGKFQLHVAGNTEETIRWRTNKTKELLAYLVHHRRTSVHKAKIMEHLWPDIPLDKANIYLHTCVYQIRKLINQLQVSPFIKVRYEENGYAVQLSGVSCDVDAWLNIAEDPNDITASSLPLYEQAVDLYGSGYLAEEDYLWSMETYEQLQMVYKAMLDKLAVYCLRNGQVVKAIRLLQRAIAVDPLHDRFHELMLTAHAAAGSRSDFIRHYDDMVHLYENELGMAPDERMQQVFHKLSEQLNMTR